MSADARCDRCGGDAVIRYIKIPIGDHDGNGQAIDPAHWPHVIDCPNCSTREQPKEGRKRATKQKE
jgi:hypothetical protein